MSRAAEVFRALAGVLTFFAVWTAGHLLDGSPTLDSHEAFNAAVALLAAAAMHLFVEGAGAPGARRVVGALLWFAPLLLVWSHAQVFGTRLGLARAAQWLAFACLGQGLGFLTAEAPEKVSAPRPLAVLRGLGFAGLAALLALFAQRALPHWAELGAGLVFFGMAMSLVAPLLGKAVRDAVTLRGLATPAVAALALYLVDRSDGASGRQLFTGLAFVAAWIEARAPRGAPSSEPRAPSKGGLAQPEQPGSA